MSDTDKPESHPTHDLIAAVKEVDWKQVFGTIQHHAKEHPGEAAVMLLAVLTVLGQATAGLTSDPDYAMQFAMLMYDPMVCRIGGLEAWQAWIRNITSLPEFAAGLEYGLAGHGLMLLARKLWDRVDGQEIELPEMIQGRIREWATKTVEVSGKVTAGAMTDLGVAVAVVPMVQVIVHTAAAMMFNMGHVNDAVQLLTAVHDPAMAAGGATLALGFLAQHGAHLAQMMAVAATQVAEPIVRTAAEPIKRHITQISPNDLDYYREEALLKLVRDECGHLMRIELGRFTLLSRAPSEKSVLNVV